MSGSGSWRGVDCGGGFSLSHSSWKSCGHPRILTRAMTQAAQSLNPTLTSNSQNHAKRSSHRAGIYRPRWAGSPSDSAAGPPARHETLQRLFASGQRPGHPATHPTASCGSCRSSSSEPLYFLQRRERSPGRPSDRPQQSQQQHPSAHATSSSAPDSGHSVDSRSEPCLERLGQTSIPATIEQNPISRCSQPQHISLFADAGVILRLADALTLSPRRSAWRAHDLH